MLISKYMFSEKDANDIIENIKGFYDGSGEKVDVIVSVISQQSSGDVEKYDDLPMFSVL